MPLLEYALMFVLGLVFGSFLSAFTWRLPRFISFVIGRSICPRCKAKINWFDNIPLISYIVLRGRCRKCSSKISLRYPIIELFSAISFILIYYFLSVNLLKVIFGVIIFLVLFSILIIDLENQIIPDSLVYFGMSIIILYLVLFDRANILYSVFSGLLASSLLLLIHLITKGRGMGLGDVKFAVFGGTLVGLNLLLIWLFSAFLTGGLTGAILVLTKKAKLKTKIAFGPFLVIAIGISFIFGNRILSAFSFL